MQVQEIMTTQPACCTADDSAAEAARLMREHDCGCIPVVDDSESQRLVGVVTDRDLAVRGLADNRGPETKVRDVMSTQPSCCGPSDDVAEVERVMSEKQVRRVPVVDGNGCCVGIVAQADLAREEEKVGARKVAEVVERISEPSPGGQRHG